MIAGWAAAACWSCKSVKKGLLVKDCQSLQTRLNLSKELAGTRVSISMMTSVGRYLLLFEYPSPSSCLLSVLLLFHIYGFGHQLADLLAAFWKAMLKLCYGLLSSEL